MSLLNGSLGIYQDLVCLYAPCTGTFNDPSSAFHSFSFSIKEDMSLCPVKDLLRGHALRKLIQIKVAYYGEDI